jgi:surfeit locus 1 family protein
MASILSWVHLLFSRRWWWTTLLVVVGMGIAILLGFWQINRNSQRQAQISQLQSVLAMLELDLNNDPLPADLTSMEYRPVTVTGQYDFEHQVVLRNQARSRMTGTDPGYALLTPLILEDGTAVMVNRGWIPLDANTPAAWRKYDEPGMVTINGILRTSLEKGEMGSSLVDPTLSPGETRLEYWNYANLPRLQEQLPYPILDVYVQQAPGSDPESIPYRQISQPDLEPGDHMGFALTWFSFAVLLLVGYPIWLKKQKNPPHPG